MKNPMSGNLPAMINSIFAAQSPQVFKYRNYQVRSAGNPYAHAILRGGVDGAGADVPNFHYETVMRVAELYAGAKLQNPAIIIDCNHSNSGQSNAVSRSASPRRSCRTAASAAISKSSSRAS